MPAPKPGRTRGRANSPFGVKWYYKPKLGKVVGRTPGVHRRSAKVLAVNQILHESKEINHPASKCASQGYHDWDSFINCLSKEFKNLLTPARIEEALREIRKKYPNLPESTARKPYWKSR